MLLRLLLAVIMVCFGIKALVYIVRQLSAKRSKPAVEEWNTARGASEMVRDPVCGLYIPAQDAVSVVKAGKTIYFCSDDCKQQFMNG